MGYRESELLETLKKDFQYPDLLFTKDYIRQTGITEDTGKSYEEVILPFLLDHAGDMVKSDTNWSMYRTVVKEAKGGSRLLTGILSQESFARSVPLDMAVFLKDSRALDWGHFDFSTMDKSGKVLTLFAMQPESQEEQPLCRLLRLWSWKESVNVHILADALSVHAPFAAKAVGLLTGASNDRYGLGKKKSISLSMKRLGALLGVSELYLLHGFHLSPVSEGLSIPGQYTKGELLTLLEKDSSHPESLYQKSYINRMGVTSDTGEPYSKVLAEWLLQHREIWMALPRGLYRRIEGSRAEFLMKNGMFRKVRKQKVLPPFGRVLSDDLLFLGSRFQQTGRPALMLYDSDNGMNAYSLLRILELPDAADNLTCAILRMFTHLATIKGNMLLKDLKLPQDTVIEGRILLDKDDRQTDLFLRDLPYLDTLMKAMGVGLVIMEDGYEALW